jgi:hypothetical protein
VAEDAAFDKCCPRSIRIYLLTEKLARQPVRHRHDLRRRSSSVCVPTDKDAFTLWEEEDLSCSKPASSDYRWVKLDITV